MISHIWSRHWGVHSSVLHHADAEAAQVGDIHDRLLLSAVLSPARRDAARARSDVRLLRCTSKVFTTRNVLNIFPQLVVMNASSFVGRLCPGLVSHRWGVKPMITTAAGCAAVLILAMIGIHNTASVVTIGVLYGFFAGASRSLSLLLVP